MLFASISGSSAATVIAVGSIAIAGMVRNGYSLKYATGIVINAGTLGILLPPSIVMVVYAAATEQSVGRLFVAGIVPGFILAAMLMVAIYVSSYRLDVPRVAWGGWRKLGRSALNAIWGLLLVVIVLGGIYVGAFTATEAAAVSAVYAFAVAVFIYRDLRLKDLFGVLLNGSRVIVMLMFIISNAGLFAYVLTSLQIPQTLTEAIASGHVQPWMLLHTIHLAILVAGNFMEPTPIVLVFAPIVFPIPPHLRITPIHLPVRVTVP